jgi:3-oxoacyl-[acyl-carrier protein] reductase
VPASIRDLEGKVALIISGSRSEAATIAESLASRGAVTVIKHAHDNEAAHRRSGDTSEPGNAPEALPPSASIYDLTDALVHDVIAEHGRLDIVIHVPYGV